MTASAFSLTLAIPSEGFTVTAGDPVIGGLHGPTRHFFCPRCMTWMFTRPEGFDQFVNLRPSVLDDRNWFVPFIEVWTQEKLRWEPYAGKPHVRFCAGGAMKIASLPLLRRREFITLLGGAAAAWPAGARAQQTVRSPMPLIGFLSSRAPNTEANLVAAFLQGLKATSHIEGQDVAIEYRWAEGRYEQLPTLAADLVRRQVAVLVTAGGAHGGPRRRLRQSQSCLQPATTR